MRTVVNLANRQHGVITHRQLLELGFGDARINRWAETGRLDRVHPRVYAVGHRRLSDDGRRLAAAMSVQSADTMVARFAAGHHHGITRRRPRHELIEIAIPSHRGAERDDVRVLRLASLTAEDRTIVRGVPCTTVERTLLDLAAVLTAVDLGKAVREAEFHGLIDRVVLAGVIARVARPRGVLALREVLGTPVARRCESRLERALLQLMLDAGLSQFVCQQQFTVGDPPERIRVDFFFPDATLVIEADEGHHERPAFRARDAYRDAGLQAVGIDVIRVTEAAMARPGDVIATIAAAVSPRSSGVRLSAER